jgi:uncharacterized protein DUF4304
MDTKEFKTLFTEVAKAHGFHAAHGGWYRELPAALFVLGLQKSNFGNYYELNLKLFLSRSAPSDPATFKKLIKNQNGDIFRRQPEEFRTTFDLDGPLDAAERRAALDEMFAALVDRIASAATSSAGLLGLRDQGVLFVLPMIEARLKAS